MDVFTVRVSLRQFDAVGDRPDAMPDLKSAIPQGVQHRTDERFRPASVASGLIQEHQIDIRMGRQFSTAIAAQGHQTTVLQCRPIASASPHLPHGVRYRPMINPSTNSVMAAIVSAPEAPSITRWPIERALLGEHMRRAGAPRHRRRMKFAVHWSVLQARFLRFLRFGYGPTALRSRTKILPSPMLPVLAARVIVSSTRGTWHPAPPLRF